MKKIILSSLMLMAAVMMSAATYTWENVVNVKLTDGNNDTYTSRFGVAPELTGAASWGAVTANLEGATVRAYTTLGGVNYEQLYLNAMENLPLTVKTYNSTSLTIQLQALYGTIALYDNVTGTVTTAVKGGADETKDYVCTVAANSTIADRFVLFYAPAGPEFCFNYNVLKVNGYEGKALIVKSEGGDEKANIASLPATYSLDLSAESGRFIVTLDGVDYQIDANPAVTPAP